MKLQKQVERYIKQNSLVEADEKILVAVSGGADSVALLYLLHEAGYSVGVAHCNFNLRADESDADERFVRDICRRLDVELFVESFDTKSIAESSGASIEMVARDLRYAWFNELCSKYSFSKIAVAHNSNDVVETFFINLSRAGGIKGLCSIQPKNGKIIRPILFAERQQVEQYLNEKELSFRTDSSNLENDYFRNKFRNIVLPQISAFVPSFQKQVLQTIGYLNDTELIYRQQIDAVKKQIVSKKSGRILINIQDLKQLSPLETYLFEILKEYGFNSDVVSQLSQSIFTERGSVFCSPEYELVIGNENLEIRHLEDKSEEVFDLLPGQKNHEAGVAISDVLNIADFDLVKDASVAFFDADKLEFPLVVRRWKAGDKMKPFGMKGRSKKLSDIFTDLKYSKFDKESAWVVCSGTEIVWLVNVRSSEFARITQQTTHFVKISVC